MTSTSSSYRKCDQHYHTKQPYKTYHGYPTIQNNLTQEEEEKRERRRVTGWYRATVIYR